MPTLQPITQDGTPAAAEEPGQVRQLEAQVQAMAHLVAVVQELSQARDVQTIQGIVRKAARRLTGSDGATFVLRDGDQCHYVDEDAIAPLWKGLRFPMEICISGWVMLNRQPVVIPDIFADARIPADAYRTTFVHSLVMVPIRKANPLGAIGTYWSGQHQSSPEEVELLQALADTTAVAMENVRVYAELEQRVQDRTQALAAANRELEWFSYSVSHDLRAPLTQSVAYLELLEEQGGSRLEPQGRHCLEQVKQASARMGRLISALLSLSRLSRQEMTRADLDLGTVAASAVQGLAPVAADRQVAWTLAPLPVIQGDPALIQAAFENLLGNALKFTSKQPRTIIEVGCLEDDPQWHTVYVRDNGAGFDPAQAKRLFTPFQRLHGDQEFPGTGIGLANVERILHRHGGRVRAEGSPGAGATFYLDFPRKLSGPGN